MCFSLSLSLSLSLSRCNMKQQTAGHIFVPRFEEAFASKERILAECDFAMKLLDEMFDKYPLILAHNDIWYTNMVYDDKTGEYLLA